MSRLFVLMFVFSYIVACAPSMIPGTRVEDTKENRTVLSVLGAYKMAVENRDINAVLALCSERYYEDNANNDPSDDYGYKDLATKVLPDTFNRLKEVRLDLEIKGVKVEKKKAYADIRFQFQAKMALPAGEKWHADTEINRIEFEDENGVWKIVRGL
ncbi:MAG: hypothetical protein IT381_30060 [Deltaproteobacteria bacterium]|nr:hypothetical protein [Deltaproteobacteria bacterium]